MLRLHFLTTVGGMSMHSEDDHGGGEAWADILARRSPEGRAIVAELQRAEAAALVVQQRVMAALTEGREPGGDYAAYEAAFAEVGRLREEVYRLARH